MMVVICPICKNAIPCDEDSPCIMDVPSHGECVGEGELGFVLQYDVDDKPYGYEPPPPPKPDERYRNFRKN